MKFLPFILKHLRRNWVRTLSTVLAMAVCIFLFCTLQTVLASINGLLESSSATRLISRNAVSLVFNLPLSYASRIAAVPGVKRVATTSWFGGSLPAKKEGKADEGSETTTDWSTFFPNMAVDEDPYFAMYPEFEIPPASRARSSGASSPPSSIGRWAITSSWRASSPRTARRAAPSSSRCARSSTPIP